MRAKGIAAGVVPAQDTGAVAAFHAPARLRRVSARGGEPMVNTFVPSRHNM
jgi:hypothetical protein